MKKIRNIDIELVEGKLYFVRYWDYGLFGKRKLEQFHSVLRDIDLNEKTLEFDIFSNLKFKEVVTIVEIKSKGKRLLEINS